MKLSELKECVDRAFARWQVQDDDPEVVIRIDNPSVGGCAKTAVTFAGIGNDWDKGCFILSTKDGIVRYKKYDPTSQDKMNFRRNLAEKRLASLKRSYEKLGQKYIAKAREQEWIEGYMEGFEDFGIEVENE